MSYVSCVNQITVVTIENLFISNLNYMAMATHKDKDSSITQKNVKTSLNKVQKAVS